MTFQYNTMLSVPVNTKDMWLTRHSTACHSTFTCMRSFDLKNYMLRCDIFPRKIPLRYKSLVCSPAQMILCY